ncbi:MAG: hypothetical protein HUJ25_07665, partial [Crocinitomicaceae bacterium]|nr:hypothetical protein [Crocinitomicaceae bacterium]
KQAKVSNGVIEDLADVNEKEFNNKKSENEVDAYVASATNPGDSDVEKANNNIKEAEQLMKEAQVLRDKADKEKDPIKANEMLTEALDKENLAKNKVESAGRIYKSARVVNNLSENTEDIVVKVPENPDDRKSSEYFDKASELEIQANNYSDRADHLRDSAETVKKKYKEAIVNEANEFDKKAQELRTEANKIKEKGNDLKDQEDNILASQIEDSNANPDTETMNELSTDSEYKNFYDYQMSAEENIGKANELEQEINILKDRQKRKIKQALVNYQDGDDPNKVVEENPDIKRDQEMIDSLTTLQKKYRDQAVQDLTDANNVLDAAGDKVKDDYIAMSNQNVGPRDKRMLGPPDSLAADYQAPNYLTGDIFRTVEEPIYNEEKTIPVDQKTSGLVYKVQVGAFRKQLPQDHFKEFAPISGQRLDNGITRYMVGYFTRENTANQARSKIRGIGYSDAFVVAYCNGQRITIDEARAIEAGEMDCPGTVLDEQFVTNTGNNGVNTTNNGTNNNVVPTDGNVEIKPTNSEEEDAVSYYKGFPDAADANQVEIVKGLFFTVQIGVYSKPVKPEVLYNITPLNSQKTPSGTIRYSTGMFSSIPSANVRKDEIQNIGITDAFVTAYFNGERISIAEANKLLEEQGPSVLFNSGENANENFGVDVANTNTTETNTTETNTTETNTTETNTTETNTTETNTTNTNPAEIENPDEDIFTLSPEDNGPPYQVNLGFFSGGVPVEFTDKLLNHQDEGILSVSDLKDNVLYYVGAYESREEAEARKQEMIDNGFKDAYIVSLNDGSEVVDDYVYHPEGVYFRIKLGKFSGEIPGEYATILLQTDGLLETEEDVEGNTYLLSRKIEELDDVETYLTEFAELGFEEMEVVSYYQYDAIPYEQAKQIKNETFEGSVEKYQGHKGLDADPFLYRKEYVYFHVQIGKFYKEVPTEFTNLLLEVDHNIIQEETLNEEWLFYTENVYTYEEAVKLKEELIGLGFQDSKIIAFHKYTRISVEKAIKILNQ